MSNFFFNLTLIQVDDFENWCVLFKLNKLMEFYKFIKIKKKLLTSEQLSDWFDPSAETNQETTRPLKQGKIVVSSAIS